VQLARRDAQGLSPGHAVKVRARRQQRPIAAAMHIVHNASHLPLHAIQTCCAALIEQAKQPLDFSGPATAGCQ
jgi:hypothetical protein